MVSAHNAQPPKHQMSPSISQMSVRKSTETYPSPLGVGMLLRTLNHDSGPRVRRVVLQIFWPEEAAHMPPWVPLHFYLMSGGGRSGRRLTCCFTSSGPTGMCPPHHRFPWLSRSASWLPLREMLSVPFVETHVAHLFVTGFVYGQGRKRFVLRIP